MFVDQINVALAAARGRALDDVSRIIWKGFAEGLLSDDQAQAFADQIHTRRTLARASQSSGSGHQRPNSIFPPRRPQRPPLRAAAIERRRRLASSGPMPPSLACKFTVGELAVLRIVGDECRDKGSCALPLAAIAARAGVCRKLAQNTMRRAKRMGLLAIDERRRPGQPNLPNFVKVVCAEWSTWLARGARSNETGGKKSAPTDTNILQKEEKLASWASHHGQRRGMKRPHDVGR